MTRHHRSLVGLLSILLLILVGTASIGNSLTWSGATNAAPSDAVTAKPILRDYIWPTDASRRVTSSFAEYRSTHFHGGIDISTNQVTGYKVFAVKDGYVYRINISPNGYGKMLYVKHPDGYVSVYAHLRGFNPAITTAARDEQYRRGTYAIDLTLDSLRLPVRQGDVIAYTGNTGFGPPHLHFELRDANLNPINPMLSQSFQVPDNIPPTINRVIVVPLGYGSTVDESAEPKYFSRFPRVHGSLTIPQMIRVHGRIGFGVDAEDKSDGSWTREGIHRLEFYLDDTLVYTMELNQVPAQESKLIDLHYDLSSLERGRGHFQKLYIDVGNTLPFYDQRPEGTGVVATDHLSEGQHAYRIVCMDNSRNQATLRGTLFANHKPEVNILRVDKDDVILAGRDVPYVSGCYVFGKRSFQSAWSKHTLPTGRFSRTSEGISLPVNTKPYDVVKVIAETKTGSQSLPMYYFIKKPFGPVRDIHIGAEVLEDRVEFTVTTPGIFTAAPVLTVQEGSSRQDVSLQPEDLNRYLGAYVPSDTVVGERKIFIDAEVNGKPTRASESITFYSVPADRSGSFAVDDGALKISYDSGAVFKPLYLEINGEPLHRGKVYVLEPRDVLLNRGIHVSLPMRTDLARERQGLYFRTTGGWAFETNRPDGNTETFSTLITRTLGEVAILPDDIPPALGRLSVAPRKGILNFSFRYFDNLSGVDPDEIKIYVDDKLVIPEIDGEHHRVSYQGDEKLVRGRHVLNLTMKDRAGNEVSTKRSFTVR